MSNYRLKTNNGKQMPGVYVGDPCYILNEDFYREFWGKENDYEDGALSKNGRPVMIVHGTAYGDGLYDGNIHDYAKENHFGFRFPVDAGVLAVVNLEFADPEKVKEIREHELGIIFDVPCDTLELSESDGDFNFHVSCNGKPCCNVYIETGSVEDEEEEDLYNEYEEEEYEEEI